VKKFGKILLSFFSIFVLCGFGSCANAPKMPRVPVQYTAVHEPPSAICRINDDDEEECILTSKQEFDNFKCMNHDDTGMVQTYIVTLISSCERWKSTD